MKEEKKSLYQKLVGYKSRGNYWSNGKFAALIARLFKMPVSPTAATWDGWDEHHKASKEASVVGEWIIEELLDKLQDIVYFPYDVYDNIRVYVRNRFIDKLQYLNTKLEKGQYYDVDTRLLHGIFETVVDFVETEKAHMHSFGDDDPEYVPLPPREAGLAHLDWEISLGEESPGQSSNAKQIKELYLWWKDVRPNRPDPYESSGYDAHNEKIEKENDGDRLAYFSMDREQKDIIGKFFDEIHKIEAEYHDEDTEMLITIIKIRRGLWT